MSKKHEDPLPAKWTIIIASIQTLLLALMAIASGILTDNRADARQSMIETGAFQRQEEIFFRTETAEYINTENAIYQKTLYPEIITPTLTPPQQITPQPSQTGNDPEQVIVEYHYLLSIGEYTKAWNMLTDKFQGNVLNNDFAKYKSYWENSDPVIVTTTVIEYKTQFKSSFIVSLYFYSDQRVRNFHYILIYDQLSKTWKIDEVLPL